MYENTTICPISSMEKLILQQAQQRIPRSKFKLNRNVIAPPISKSKRSTKALRKLYSKPPSIEGGNHPFDIEKRLKILNLIKSRSTPISAFTIADETSFSFTSAYHVLKALQSRGQILCKTEPWGRFTINYFTAT